MTIVTRDADSNLYVMNAMCCEIVKYRNYVDLDSGSNQIEFIALHRITMHSLHLHHNTMDLFETNNAFSSFIKIRNPF